MTAHSNPNPLNKKIPLVELFGPTIQGEGHVIGLPTYFLRFGLCDYNCTMCDSRHAIDPEQVKANAEWLTQDEIFKKFHIRSFWNDTTNTVTFSGGNPCIHDLSHLVRLLRNNGYFICVETQGTFHPTWLHDCYIVTVSPKGPGMGERLDLNVLDEFMQDLREHPGLNMKVVLFDTPDIEVAAALYTRYCNWTFDNVRKLPVTKIANINSILLPSDRFFLSLGNPHLKSELTEKSLTDDLRTRYLELWKELQNHPVLNSVRFLPQWHVFLYGNRKGV
jgi:7-carboxy-7-deazaguanine synthase